MTREEVKKKKINDLIYLRKSLDNVIDNAITESVLRALDRYDYETIRNSLLYQIDEHLYHNNYYERLLK